jgi:16S rRNA (cytidine1402-2'-O)-methyltransferase
VSAAGVLYVVATPIGNLGDLTRRAAETLAEVDRVVAEDTRRTRALLTHLGIQRKQVMKLDANASDGALRYVVERVRAGERVALVTDAGTPGVSDPGPRLVRLAIEAGVVVTVVPGPSAVTAAVAASGLVDGPFAFLGFLPRHGEKRRRAIDRIKTSEEPIVLFEAPTRLGDTLAELGARMPSRQACVLRELTKVHEEILHGTLAELAERGVIPKGEVTIVVACSGEGERGDELDVDALVLERLDAGDTARTVADDVAALSGKSRREVYARVLELRRLRER